MAIFRRFRVNRLIKDLLHENSNVRRSAALNLGIIGDRRAVEPLIAALEDKDYDIRHQAVISLGDIGDPRAVMPLIGIWKSVDKDLVWSAVQALQKIGKPAAEPLIAALTDEDSFVRHQAAQAVGATGDPRAVEPLIRALQGEYPGTRFCAAKALGEIGDPRAIEPLIRAFGDGGRIRDSAVKAVVRIGKAAMGPLAQVLGHKEHSVRYGAVEALKKMGWEPRDDVEKAYYLIADWKWAQLVRLGKPAVKPLAGFLRDGYDYFRKEVSKTLEELGWEPRDDVEKAYYLITKGQWDDLVRLGELAVEPLVEMLKGPQSSRDRAEIVKALAELGWEPGDNVEKAYYLITKGQWDDLVRLGEPAVEPLVYTLQVEPLKDTFLQAEPDVASSAALCLGEIGDPRAVMPLIVALNSSWEDVRSSAAKALGEIGDPRAVQPLHNALDGRLVQYTPEKSFKDAVHRALEKIRAKPR